MMTLKRNIWKVKGAWFHAIYGAFGPPLIHIIGLRSLVKSNLVEGLFAVPTARLSSLITPASKGAMNSEQLNPRIMAANM